MEKTNETPDAEEVLDLPEVQEGEEDTTDWKAEAQKLREKAIAQRERTKLLKHQLAERDAKLAEKALSQPEAPKPTNAGDLDETQLDYLDLKGISDSDEIDVIQKVMRKTGATVRQALKDDYVIEKLKALKAEREVKAATPSSTKRAGQSANSSLELALEKYERTNELPADFELRKQVVNAKLAKETGNKPSWH